MRSKGLDAHGEISPKTRAWMAQSDQPFVWRQSTPRQQIGKQEHGLSAFWEEITSYGGL